MIAKYQSGYIAGLEEAYRLLNLDEELDYGPGRILKRIEQMKTAPDTTEPDRTGMSREQLESALAQREDQLRQVEAQCWAMREVLGSAITILDKCLTTDGEYGRELSTLLCRLRGAAKSTPSSILARLEEARWLLETETVGNEEWFKRRDSWLSGQTPTGPIPDLSNPDSKESHIGTGMAGAVPDSEGEPFGSIPSDRASELEKAHNQEIGDFQNEVRNLVIKLSGAPDHLIDGKGSDAGWQEFTLAEISQGFAFLADKTESDRAQLETARGLLSRCPGIRTDETREYWDEVQAFLGKEEV